MEYCRSLQISLLHQPGYIRTYQTKTLRMPPYETTDKRKHRDHYATPKGTQPTITSTHAPCSVSRSNTTLSQHSLRTLQDSHQAKIELKQTRSSSNDSMKASDTHKEVLCHSEKEVLAPPEKIPYEHGWTQYDPTETPGPEIKWLLPMGQWTNSEELTIRIIHSQCGIEVKKFREPSLKPDKHELKDVLKLLRSFEAPWPPKIKLSVKQGWQEINVAGMSAMCWHVLRKAGVVFDPDIIVEVKSADGAEVLGDGPMRIEKQLRKLAWETLERIYAEH